MAADEFDDATSDGRTDARCRHERRFIGGLQTLERLEVLGQTAGRLR